MPDLLIKGVDVKVLEKLKVRAEEDGDSLESEVGIILRYAAKRFE